MGELIGRAVYWVCRATSLNYAMCEVVDYLQARLHMDSRPSVETYDFEQRRPLLEYVADLDAARLEVTVELRWRRPGAIFHFDPTCNDAGSCRVVHGHLLRVWGSFPVPPPEDFHPRYHVDFQADGGWFRLSAKSIQ